MLCEYSVRSSAVKRMLVNAYVHACLCTEGLLADRKMIVNATVSNDTLIYPCNKKYRIFDFEKNTVEVIVKDGFCNNDLLHEIEFRTRERLPEFVPTLLSQTEYGYSEKIIDGKPLARITNGFDDYRDRAYRLLFDYAKQSLHTVSAFTYVEQLAEEIMKSITDKVRNKKLVECVVKTLVVQAKTAESVELCFSHGDLQSGNIWVENKTDKIYIIDWESFGERSVLYDKAVLYDGLRPGGVTEYMDKQTDFSERAFVLLEDIVYQLTDLNNLPEDFGEEQFEKYIEDIHFVLNNKKQE